MEVEINVLAYNVWGMPRQFGGQQKSLRMPQIAKKLAEGCKKVRLSLLIHFHFLVSWHYQKGEYDIILLSELWMKHDHGIIKQELVGE